MSETTAAAELRGGRPEKSARWPAWLGRAGDFLVRSILPLVLALGTGAIILWAIGVDPIQYYKDVWSGGFEFSAWQDTAMRVAPLLLIAVGLIVVFKAGIWNLGMDGQFLLAAAVIAGIGPRLEHHLPNAVNLVFLFLVAGAVGAAWTIVPALLKARYELNEIITTLMMSFIGINLAQILVKGTFQDPTTTTPQTRAFDFSALLPSIPGTESMTRRWPGIHVGVLVAVAAAIVVWFMMSRTSFGLRLQVLGASTRSARHMGLDVSRLIVVAFLLSGMFVGFAAATEILGVKGYVRADWNPAFGLWVVPLVFLARLHAIGVIPYVVALSLASIGGDYAAQNAGLTSKFTLLLVGLTLIFMALTEWIARRAELSGSYLPGAHRAAPLAGREHMMVWSLPPARSPRLRSRRWSGAPFSPARRSMFAALGELVSQRAGVLNIGLEGMMLIGAYAGFVAAYHGGSEWYGFAAGMAAGAGVSLLMVLFCVRWGLDQIVDRHRASRCTARARPRSSSRPSSRRAGRRSGRRRQGRDTRRSPTSRSSGAGASPNGSVFTQPLVVYLGLGLAVIVAWMLRRTHIGLNVRAAGDAPGALDAAGVSVFVDAVVGGAVRRGDGRARRRLPVHRRAGGFQDTLVGGRGFIAIVLAMLARGRPALGRGSARSCSGSRSRSPTGRRWRTHFGLIIYLTDYLFMLPFVVVLLVLVLFGRRAYLPAALALPYERGTR